jgi:hypothetical protein
MFSDTKPLDYCYCQNDSCKKAEKCLRYLCYKELDEKSDELSIRVVNPKKYEKDSDGCRMFNSCEAVTLAWGIKNLFSDIPFDAAKKIKSQILSEFGRTKYYRFFREELPVTPESRQKIRKIFMKNGIETEPAYSRFTQELFWH